MVGAWALPHERYQASASGRIISAERLAALGRAAGVSAQRPTPGAHHAPGGQAVHSNADAAAVDDLCRAMSVGEFFRGGRERASGTE